MEPGLNFIPKYVRQESVLQFGDTVTHEEYNTILNLHTEQGDYNTEVLNALFTADSEDTYHIKYIDDQLLTLQNTVEETVADFEEAVADFEERLTAAESTNSIQTTSISNIVNGTTTVGKATEATRIAGITTAGANKYYGTDAAGAGGFLDVPDFLYAIPTEETSLAVEGIYFLPGTNTVAESMLTEEVRTKLNQTGLTDYDALTSRPQIAGVTLTGNKTLADLGIQSAGSFVTTTALSTALSDYSDTDAMESYVASELTDYVANTALTAALANYVTSSSLSTTLSSYALANSAAVIQVGSTFTGTPKTGDLLITL